MLGLNHRERVHEATYDIQSQDLGPERKTIETRVYRNGKILDTVRSCQAEPLNLPGLQESLKRQHEQICTKVRDGTYELLFLWVSRGIIALESQEYFEALDSFESVLAMEETHTEVNACIEKVRSCLTEKSELRLEVEHRYRKRIRALAASGRVLEATRKGLLLERLLSPLPRAETPAPPAHPLPPPRREPGSVRRYAMVSLAGLLLVCSLGLVISHAHKKTIANRPFALATTYLEQDKPLPARDLLNGVLQRQPVSEEALRLFWHTFDREGDYADAVSSLKGLLQREPASPMIHVYLAEAYRKQDRPEEAMEAYQSASKQQGPPLACTIGTALCHLDQKEPQEAIDLLERMLENGSEDFRIDYCLGMAYRQLGRPGRASIYYAQALNKQPGSAVIYRTLAECLLNLHQEDKARGLLEQAVHLETASSDSDLGSSFSLHARKGPGATSSAGPGRGFPFPLL